MRGTGPGALDEGRDWRRVAVVTAPWVLAAVLAVLGVVAARGAPGSPAPAATGSPAAEPPAPTEPAAPAAVDAGSGDLGTVSLPAEVELAVLATARQALGSAGLAGTAQGADRWTLEVRIAAMETVTSAAAVVTVHGLVIEHRDGDWHGPRPEAVAVLLRTSPEAAVVGGPWPLPPPTLPTGAVDLRTVSDPDPSVVAPLQDAGWLVDEITSVATTDDALLRIGLHGTPPAAARSGDHVLWLLDAPGGPRLLPLATPTATEDLP